MGICFNECFDEEKIKEISCQIIGVNEKLLDLAREPIELPRTVECMSEKEIAEGLKVGGGHGLFIAPNTIKINPHMGPTGILLNYIHENIHFILPDASENLVDHLTDLVAYQLKINR